MDQTGTEELATPAVLRTSPAIANGEEMFNTGDIITGMVRRLHRHTLFLKIHEQTLRVTPGNGHGGGAKEAGVAVSRQGLSRAGSGIV